ncbi:MAG: glycogen debranching enzyme GlgX [Burkholderiales bacterium RIFCSPLOWO2_12_FULL_61_40]|nr:MAG: glycogen debranching enzyme GlgX [Burkholderiales bacterium RIFCSPLOWO2_12_FULL_61_40]
MKKQPRTTSSALSCTPGRPWPMGASCMHLDGRGGVNFAVFSRHAERIEVCLYDAQGLRETARFALPACTNGVWHGFIAGLGEGQLYGLRAHGPYQPTQGQRFNPAKLLIDPFSRALVGSTSLLSLEFDYQATPAPRSDMQEALADPVDNAPRIPKSKVLDLTRELQNGATLTPCPRVPWEHTVLYEAHVKGLTQRHPQVPTPLRGTFAGLASPAMLTHYQQLGITTLCLLPVHLHLTEAHLLKKGLRNYWGYNTLGFFIPEPTYSSDQYGDERTEFRHMVDLLHRHGLEVVLDVVFNHSAESDAVGPTLSWRGLDNASWYALDPEGEYLNHSGCGNSFNLAQPCAIQLVMDSLRWWVQAFGVDGFRFDLATALGRDPILQHNFHSMSGLLAAIGQDPVLAGIKLISEPWDMGPAGYQLGQFPAGWHEWNDRFRDTGRAFWLGFESSCGEFARRLTGSSDRFHHDGRSPLSSINLITTHDGMTLTDLTSYGHKHNAANGEDNRDGPQHDLSANAGIEGPTQENAVLMLRGQWRRALLATLFCAQGVPQLLAGDEIGHSQQGNNNAYCQDNEISWLNWQAADQGLTDYVAQLIHLRQAHAALRHANWFVGDTDIAWRSPAGSQLTVTEWDAPELRSFACVVEVADGNASSTERWFMAFHATDQPQSFALPGGPWLLVLDSAAAMVRPQTQWASLDPSMDAITLTSHTVVALVQSPSTP